VVGRFRATSGEHISRFSSNHRSLGQAQASLVMTLTSLDYNFVPIIAPSVKPKQAWL